MTYNIPDDIAPYLEFIPESMLSDVITDALLAHIFAEPEDKQEVASAQLDMSQLLEQLKQMTAGNQEVAKTLTKAVSNAKPEDKEVVLANVHVDGDVPDDLAAIVDDFAALAFK